MVETILTCLFVYLLVAFIVYVLIVIDEYRWSKRIGSNSKFGVWDIGSHQVFAIVGVFWFPIACVYVHDFFGEIIRYGKKKFIR